MLKKKDERVSVGTVFTEPSLTQQQFEQECDINNIVNRFQETGMIPNRERRQVFGDFRNIDFREAQNTIIAANEAFMALDPKIRQRFQNDPANLVDFLNNKENREEAIQLGFIEKPVQKPAEPVVPPPALPIGAKGGAGG